MLNLFSIEMVTCWSLIRLFGVSVYLACLGLCVCMFWCVEYVQLREGEESQHKTSSQLSTHFITVTFINNFRVGKSHYFKCLKSSKEGIYINSLWMLPLFSLGNSASNVYEELLMRIFAIAFGERILRILSLILISRKLLGCFQNVVDTNTWS